VARRLARHCHVDGTDNVGHESGRSRLVGTIPPPWGGDRPTFIGRDGTVDSRRSRPPWRTSVIGPAGVRATSSRFDWRDEIPIVTLWARSSPLPRGVVAGKSGGAVEAALNRLPIHASISGSARIRALKDSRSVGRRAISTAITTSRATPTTSYGRERPCRKTQGVFSLSWGTVLAA
jgi:hypothetical protein